ncbi:uncharacterized protein [Antedon mediterranea]|uniref:uncharacterized protein n=1 Tax=Antedon mediterranea TaxID=105859 RepID=UPI003AF4EDD5
MATPEKNQVRRVPVEAGLIVTGFDVKDDDKATIENLLQIFPSKYHLQWLMYPVGTKRDIAIVQFTNAKDMKEMSRETRLKFEKLEIIKTCSVYFTKIDPVVANVLSHLPSIQCEDNVKYFEDENCFVFKSKESIEKVKKNITTDLQRWLTDLKSSKVRPPSSAASDSDGGSESSFVVLEKEEESSSTLNQTERDVIACSVVVTVKENKECNINDEMSKCLKLFGSSTTSVTKEGGIVVFDDESDVKKFIKRKKSDQLIECSKLQIPLVDRGEYVKFKELFPDITKHFQQKWNKHIVTLAENKFIICCKFEEILDDVSEEFKRQLKGKYKSIKPSQQVIESKPTTSQEDSDPLVKVEHGKETSATLGDQQENANKKSSPKVNEEKDKKDTPTEPEKNERISKDQIDNGGHTYKKEENGKKDTSTEPEKKGRISKDQIDNGGHTHQEMEKNGKKDTPTEPEKKERISKDQIDNGGHTHQGKEGNDKKDTPTGPEKKERISKDQIDNRGHTHQGKEGNDKKDTPTEPESNNVTSDQANKRKISGSKNDKESECGTNKMDVKDDQRVKKIKTDDDEDEDLYGKDDNSSDTDGTNGQNHKTVDEKEDDEDLYKVGDNSSHRDGTNGQNHKTVDKKDDEDLYEVGDNSSHTDGTNGQNHKTVDKKDDEDLYEVGDNSSHRDGTNGQNHKTVDKKDDEDLYEVGDNSSHTDGTNGQNHKTVDKKDDEDLYEVGDNSSHTDGTNGQNHKTVDKKDDEDLYKVGDNSSHRDGTNGQNHKTVDKKDDEDLYEVGDNSSHTDGTNGQNHKTVDKKDDEDLYKVGDNSSHTDGTNGQNHKSVDPVIDEKSHGTQNGKNEAQKRGKVTADEHVTQSKGAKATSEKGNTHQSIPGSISGVDNEEVGNMQATCQESKERTSIDQIDNAGHTHQGKEENLQDAEDGKENAVSSTEFKQIILKGKGMEGEERNGQIDNACESKPGGKLHKNGDASSQNQQKKVKKQDVDRSGTHNEGDNDGHRPTDNAGQPNQGKVNGKKQGNLPSHKIQNPNIDESNANYSKEKSKANADTKNQKGDQRKPDEKRQKNIDESQQKTAKVASKKTVDRSGYLTVHNEIYQFLIKFKEKELKEIEKKYKINILWLEDKFEQNLGVVSKRGGDEENRSLGEAKFIDLYQKVHNSVQCQKVSVENKAQQDIKNALRNTRKEKRNILLLHDDDDSNVVFVGEENDVKQAKKIFKQALGIPAEERHLKIVSDQAGLSESSSDPLLSEITVGRGIKIIIKQDDITLEDAEVLVNAANGELKHNGGVAKAIAVKAGNEINKEGQEKLRSLKDHQLEVGEMLHTRGYNLKAKYVIHAVGPTYKMKQAFQALLEMTFFNCLEYADSNLEASSISIPLISSGNFGGKKQQCAKALAVSIKEFVKVDKARCLKEIRLVNIDSEATQEIMGQINAVIWSKPPTSSEVARNSTEKKIKTHQNARISLKNAVVVEGFREYESPGETKYQLAMILHKPNNGGGEIEHVKTMQNKAIVIFSEQKVARSLIGNGTSWPGSKVNLQIRSIEVGHQKEAVMLDGSQVLPIIPKVLDKLPIQYYELGDMKLLYLDNQNTTKKVETYVNAELEKWLNNQLKDEEESSLSQCVIVTNFEKFKSHETTGDKIELTLQVKNRGGGDVLKIIYPFGKCEERALAVFYQPAVASSLIEATKISNKKTGHILKISPFKVGHSEKASIFELGEVAHLLDPTLKTNIFKTLKVNGEYLRDGKLVLYNKADVDKVMEYVTDQLEQSLASYLGTATSASSSRSRGDDGVILSDVKFALPGGIAVTVRQGDITEENVDVIVNAANGQLQHGSGVARAIADKAGRQLHEEGQKKLKRRKRYLYVSEVLHTAGYNLKARYVIHAVGPRRNEYKNEDEFVDCLEKTFLNCLKYAFDLEITSIAIPLISSGIFGGNKAKCAQSLLNSILLFVKNGKHRASTINKIHLVNIDVEATSEIQDVFKKWQQSGKKTEVEECPICLDVLTEPVKKLQCGHRFCSNCIDDELKHRKVCPMCRGNVKVLKGNKTPAKKDEVEECPICFDVLTETVKKQLQCGHKFCRNCIDIALQHRNACPICGIILGVLKGNQPPGRMTVNYSPMKLPGYPRCGSIVIVYNIPNGIQTREHPNPGRYYQGTGRTAYLPDNQEGRHVAGLLQKAFDARLIFTIGTSITSGTQNAVIWNDIHHKTSMSGEPYGYPDPTYLSRVTAELAAKGIK